MLCILVPRGTSEIADIYRRASSGARRLLGSYQVACLYDGGEFLHQVEATPKLSRLHPQ